MEPCRIFLTIFTIIEKIITPYFNYLLVYLNLKKYLRRVLVAQHPFPAFSLYSTKLEINSAPVFKKLTLNFVKYFQNYRF